MNPSSNHPKVYTLDSEEAKQNPPAVVSGNLQEDTNTARRRDAEMHCTQTVPSSPHETKQ
jgi:hypothetical protein